MSHFIKMAGYNATYTYAVAFKSEYRENPCVVNGMDCVSHDGKPLTVHTSNDK